MAKLTTYTVQFKIKAVEAFYKTKDSNMKTFAESIGVPHGTFKRWIGQYKDGTLSLNNAISVSSKPNAVVNGDVYHLAGRDFKTKDEAIRFAVELAGGLTVTTMKTISVSI